MRGEKMQNTQAKEDVTKLHEIKQKSSYELITEWLDIGYTLKLSSNALNLMTHLLRFYNPNKKYVFPHQQTLADRTKTSVASVKRGLSELLKANLIIKTKTKNGNLYAFTGKLFELLDSSNGAMGTAQHEPCMDKNQIKRSRINQHHIEAEKLEPKKDDDFLSKSSKNKITLADVPTIIKDNPKVKNPCGYWASLTQEEKQIQLDKQAEIERKKVVKLEAERKKREAEKQAELERQKQAEYNARPLCDTADQQGQFTKEQALNYIKKCKFMGKGKILKSSMIQGFIAGYNLNIDEILAE